MNKGRTRIIAIGVDIDTTKDTGLDLIYIGNNDNYIKIDEDGDIYYKNQASEGIKWVFNIKDIYKPIKQALMDSMEDLDND